MLLPAVFKIFAGSTYLQLPNVDVKIGWINECESLIISKTLRFVEVEEIKYGRDFGIELSRSLISEAIIKLEEQLSEKLKETEYITFHTHHLLDSIILRTDGSSLPEICLILKFKID